MSQAPLGFDDIAFENGRLYWNGPSLGTISGDGIEEGHILLLLKTKKKVWLGKIGGDAGGGRRHFRVDPLNYEDDLETANDMVTVTVVNPVVPPIVTGPHDAEPPPTIVP